MIIIIPKIGKVNTIFKNFYFFAKGGGFVFIDTLDFLLKERNVSAAKLLADCKIGKNQYTYWKQHKNTPSGETLQKIADYFDVSVDFLLGKEQGNDDRQKLAAWVRTLSDDDVNPLMKKILASCETNCGACLRL